MPPLHAVSGKIPAIQGEDPLNSEDLGSRDQRSVSLRETGAVEAAPPILTQTIEKRFRLIFGSSPSHSSTIS